MKPADVVTLDGVGVRYHRGMPWAQTWVDAVRDVNLCIRAGETLGLVGESGSGKSTTGKVCLGLLRPSVGRAELDGEPLFHFGRRRPGTLAAVLQHPEWSLNPKLTLGKSVAEPLSLSGVRRPSAAWPRPWSAWAWTWPMRSACRMNGPAGNASGPRLPAR